MPGRNPDSILYRGRSMSPLFEEGDEVVYRPYENRRIKRGDVIVFSQPETSELIIHRVIHVDRNGIRTRGDNNASVDPWLLHPDHILGRIIFIRRNRRRLPIGGGIRGEGSALSLRMYWALRKKLVHALDPFLMSRWYFGIFSKWIPGRHQPRIVSFDRPYGKEFLLIMGGRVIGRRFAGNDTWHIRRRWRPFINRNEFN